MAVPVLETERLVFRPVEPEDVEAFYELYGDPEVTRFLSWDRPDRATYQGLFDAARARWAGYPEGLGVWLAREREGGAVVGVYMLKPLAEGPEIEVGYHLARPQWGKGYATEGARALVRHGLGTVGLPEIVGVVDPENGPSIRVLERAGLTRAGELHVYGTDCWKFVIRS